VKNLCPQVDVSRRVLTYSKAHLPSFLVRILALAERIHRWKRSRDLRVRDERVLLLVDPTHPRWAVRLYGRARAENRLRGYW